MFLLFQRPINGIITAIHLKILTEIQKSRNTEVTFVRVRKNEKQE